MNEEIQKKFITELDAVLNKKGFRFIKSKQQWERKALKSDIEWVHLNFGLSVINPSFGVTYKDFARLFPKEICSVDTVSRMVSPITGVTYTEKSDPKLMSQQISELSIKELVFLCDRLSVINHLISEQVTNWPVSSYSARIRLLPLLLVQQGNINKALNCVKKFNRESIGKDQFLPNYGSFTDSFVGIYDA